MDSGLWWLVAALAVTGAGGVVVAVSAHRARGRLQAELVESRRELRVLEQRLETLARRVAPPSATPQEFVITTAGAPGTAHLPTSPRQALAGTRPTGQPVPSITPAAFATAALGESLVTLVSLGHGVRRALSAESRNRIGFEMRREVRRARKQRKRDLKEAKRHLRANALHQDAA